MTPEQWAEKAWNYWNFSSGSKEEEIAVVAEMFREAIIEVEAENAEIRKAFNNYEVERDSL